MQEGAQSELVNEETRIKLRKQREDEQVDLSIFVTFVVLILSFGVIVTVSPPIGLAFMVVVFALYAVYFAIFGEPIQ